jgi:Cd2+/Zn2+-exporting ATPase
LNHAKVLAGTILLSGYLEIEVQKKSVDSTLAKIIQITFESTKEKAELQKFIEKFASIYTPIAIGLSFLVFLVPVVFFHGDFHKWLEQALTLLVISCPCSLVISTPVSIYTAVGAAAKRGIIIKGGRVLEAISKVTLVALDKTRTITTGQPEVTDIVSTAGMSENEVLACAAGIEKLSEHPLAQAIVAAAEKRKISPHEASAYKSVLGKGAEAECLICSEKKHFIGSRSFALEKITLNAKEIAVLDRLESEGKTCVLIWNKVSVEGILGLQDTIKPESKKAIADLKSLLISTAILTGDHEKAGQAVAKEVGVDNVYAGLLPTAKSEIIKELERKDQRVAMVGDGVNDAPALAASTVGIAMGAAGSDAAIEVAGVAILNDNLDSLPFLVRLGRRTWSIIRFNSFFAIGIKIATLGLAFSGYSSLGLAIFADVGVTIIVVIIALLGSNSL